MSDLKDVPSVSKEVRLIEPGVTKQTEQGKETGRRRLESLQEYSKDVAIRHSIATPTTSIRLGDYILIQDRPCQVIKIGTCAFTGQYRYMGVDLFTKSVFEESASVYNDGASLVQTMLRPMLRRYEVLGIREDGHVVALTDNGFIKEDLPVLNQSNLSNRLKKAFEDHKGSVYVLLLEGDRTDLVVDVTLVPSTRLEDETKCVKVPLLHRLAQNGDLYGLQVALANGENVNSCDNTGRTAIFHAIQNRQHHFITELLEKRIDIGRLDKEGKNAFDYIMEVVKEDRAFYLLAEAFLERKPSLTQSISSPVPILLSSSASEDLDKIETLLSKFGERGAIEVNKTDRLGYTPLHEAACFGRYDVVEKLINSGSNINAEVALGGDTITLSSKDEVIAGF